MNREIGYMDIRLFRKIVNEMSCYSWRHLRIVGLGEPALHPHLEEMLDDLADKPLKTEFTTNGTLLMRFDSEKILGWPLDILGISIDGFDAKSYSRYRPNGDYDMLRRKVKKLFETKRKMGHRFPLLRIRNVVFPETTPEQIEAFTRSWLPFADIITFNTLISKFDYEPNENFRRCEDILLTMHVRWDGRVPLCGYQLWCGGSEWLGSIRDHSLEELWHADRLLEVSKCHADEVFTGIDFCKNCFYTQKRKIILDISKSHDRYRNAALSRMYRLAISLCE
jgi:hypothetical protein